MAHHWRLQNLLNSYLAKSIVIKQRTLFCFSFATTREKQGQRFLSTKFWKHWVPVLYRLPLVPLLSLMLANKIFRMEGRTVLPASLRVQQFTTSDPVLFIFISRMVPINFLNRSDFFVNKICIFHISDKKFKRQPQENQITTCIHAINKNFWKELICLLSLHYLLLYFYISFIYGGS
jgi:hypothetical protein